MNSADAQHIEAVLTTHTDLWVQHEMDEWGDYFTEDSDFITHRGVWWRSRQENVAGHKDVPEPILDQKQNYVQQILSIDTVTSDVALVHTGWSWPGHMLPSADSVADRSGLITYVMVKRHGRWLIRAAHNTRTDGLDDFTTHRPAS